MMRLAIYNPETGRIGSAMEFSEAGVEDALLNIPDGMLAVEVGAEIWQAKHRSVGSEWRATWPRRQLPCRTQSPTP